METVGGDAGVDERGFRKGVVIDGNLGKGKGNWNGERRDGKVVRAYRGRLEAVLREAVDVRWGHVLEGIERSAEGGHTLLFKNDQKVESSLIVDASGMHSPTRKSLLPEAELNILPYVVFRGTRRLDAQFFKESYE